MLLYNMNAFGKFDKKKLNGFFAEETFASIRSSSYKVFAVYCITEKSKQCITVKTMHIDQYSVKTYILSKLGYC